MQKSSLRNERRASGLASRFKASQIRGVPGGEDAEKEGNQDMDEKTLYDAHPAMFKSNPIGFILCIVLIAVYGIGLLVLLIWWVRVLGTKLTLTNERVTLRKGILSKHTNDVYHTDIRNVQVRQTLFQRIFRTGSIAVASAGHGGIEIFAQGIPNPQKVKDLIDQQRRK